MLKNGNIIFDQKLLAEVTQFISDNRIDCIILDPFIAFHQVPEIDNIMMEKVIKEGFEQIALSTNCCIELCQHTRKTAQAQQGELTADDSRGAGAIVNAARSVRVINRMSAQEADLPNIEPDERRHYLRISRDKPSMLPPGKAKWVHLASIELPNATSTRPRDNVQAAEPWAYPKPFDSVKPDDMRWAREEVRRKDYRVSPNSPHWFGYVLAERLKLDIGLPGVPRDQSQKGNRQRISAIISTWIGKGVLAKETRQDEARRDREFYVAGNWDEDPEEVVQ
jgi:hypothetical protein